MAPMERILFGICTFLAILAMILVIIAVATTHWIDSNYSIPIGNSSSNISVRAYIGFFKFCYDSDAKVINSTCLNLHSPISAPAGLLILGIILLAFAGIIGVVLVVKPYMNKYLPLVLLVLLFLASVVIIGGYSISWYYLYNPIGTGLASMGTQSNSVGFLLLQKVTAGYSHNLSVAGQFFSYIALTLAAYIIGMARRSDVYRDSQNG